MNCEMVFLLLFSLISHLFRIFFASITAPMISERSYRKLLKSLPSDGIALLKQRFAKSGSQIYRDLRSGETNVLAMATELAAKEKIAQERRKQKTEALIKTL